MKLTDLYLGQLERETPGTRKALERVPEGKNDWKPHEKSMPFGYLSSLVASMPNWIAMMIDRDDLDLASGTGSQPAVASNHELLDVHEKALAAARKSLTNTSEEHLMIPWRLLYAGKVVDEKPRYQMISDTISHWAHHRAQLTVYLRLLDVPVPSIYGPSADEASAVSRGVS